MNDQTIDKTLAGEERPLVTFALFAYNQEGYIREAVEGALSQTYSPLEIILSDDCSSDDTFRIITDLANGYRGPHKLVLLRNEANLGLVGHINKVMKITSGELIVVAAGDDVSYPNRVEKLVNQWLENKKESGSIFSAYNTIDGAGNIECPPTIKQVKQFRLADRDLESSAALCVGTLGCTHAWTKDVFHVFGPMHERLVHEDITIPLRSALLGSVTFMPDQLVLYRIIPGTQSRISYANYRDRFNKMARYWEGRVANYEQFSADADLALKLKLSTPDDVRWLKDVVVSPTADLAQLNHQFFRGKFFDQVLSIATSSRTVPIGRKLKLLALAFLPWVYGIGAR